MNPFVEPTAIVSVWWLITVAMLWLENRYRLISELVSSEAHAFGLLLLAVVCTTIVRSYMHGAIALPNVRNMAAPRKKYRGYARRTEGVK